MAATTKPRTSPAGETMTRSGPRSGDRKKDCFTLIELLVVLAIIGLLLTLAPIGLSRMMPGLEVQAAARQLSASLRNARSIAIRDNQEATLTLDLEERRYSLAGETRHYEIDEDIEIKLLTATSEQESEQVGSIRFFPDGTSTGGTVTLTGGGVAYDVLVDWLTGRIEIAEAKEEF